MKLFNRVLQSLALPSIVIFAASNLLYSNSISAAQLNFCVTAARSGVELCEAAQAEATAPQLQQGARAVNPTYRQRPGSTSGMETGQLLGNTLALGQATNAWVSVRCRGLLTSLQTEHQCCPTDGGTINYEVTGGTVSQAGAFTPTPNVTPVPTAPADAAGNASTVVAACSSINRKANETQASSGLAGAQLTEVADSVSQMRGISGAATGVRGWMSNNPLKTAAIAGVGGYVLGSMMGDNKEQKEIDKLKKELASKSVTGGTGATNDDCSKPGIITKQECATHFASLCYNNSSAASCAEFNNAYCNGGAASTVSNPISGSGSFYCSMVGIKAACANSSDATMTCTWYRQLSQACLTNLAQIQSATCMPQYAGNVYSSGCTAMPSQKLCQAPFSTILSNSAQVAAQGSASAASVAANASSNSAIGSASVGVSVGSSESLPITRGMASTDVSPMGANLFSIQDSALTGVNLVGSGQ